MSYGYGMNENQNHLVAEGRTTSRVTNVPGGKSSVYLGWDSPPKPSNTSSHEDMEKMKIVGSAVPVTVSVKPETKITDSNPQPVRASGGSVSSNAYAQGSRMNLGNVITDRPTRRVTQPPGGRSSITFG